MLRPLYADLDGHFRCFDFDRSEVVHVGEREEGNDKRWLRIWRGRRNLIRTVDGRWLTGWHEEKPHPESGQNPEYLYRPFPDAPNRPAFREIEPQKVIDGFGRLKLEAPTALLEDARVFEVCRTRTSPEASTATIGMLLEAFNSKLGDRTCLWPEGERARFPGLGRLETLSRNEWSEDLDRERFCLLRDHTSRILDQLHHFREVGTDLVDALTIHEAAEILESSCPDTDANGQPTGRVENPTRKTCDHCGNPLTEKERSRGRGRCQDCVGGRGMIMELDVAIKSGEGATYDPAGNDPLCYRFLDWPELNLLICQVNGKINRVDRDAWEWFRKWFKVVFKRNEEKFLSSKRAEVIQLLHSRLATFDRPDSILPGPSPALNPNATNSTSGEPAKQRLTRQEKNIHLKDYLLAHPRATAKKAGLALGIPDQTVRGLPAWKARQQERTENQPEGKSRGPKSRWLTDGMLAVMPGKDPDPSDRLEKGELNQRDFLENGDQEEKKRLAQLPREDHNTFYFLWGTDRVAARKMLWEDMESH